MSAQGLSLLLKKTGTQNGIVYKFKPEIFLYNAASRKISVPKERIADAEQSARVGKDDPPLMGCPAGIAVIEGGDNSIKTMWDWYLKKGRRFYEK